MTRSTVTVFQAPGYGYIGASRNDVTNRIVREATRYENEYPDDADPYVDPQEAFAAEVEKAKGGIKELVGTFHEDGMPTVYSLVVVKVPADWKPASPLDVPQKCWITGDVVDYGHDYATRDDAFERLSRINSVESAKSVLLEHCHRWFVAIEQGNRLENDHGLIGQRELSLCGDSGVVTVSEVYAARIIRPTVEEIARAMAASEERLAENEGDEEEAEADGAEAPAVA
jgi:hypothetical protein